MTYDPKRHHRRSIRLQGYDYSKKGAYFITICTKNQTHIFGHIENGKMLLNHAGTIAQNEWLKTEKIRKNIILDAFIIMPNHIHGIIIIKSPAPNPPDSQNPQDPPNPPVRAYCNTPLRMPIPGPCPMPRQLKSPSQNIGAIIRGYKSTITLQINLLLNQPGTKLLHRNYFDHIIHDEPALIRIRQYITNNPQKWETDRHNIRKKHFQNNTR